MDSNSSSAPRQSGTQPHARLPSRLHHTAYVTRDLDATRRFYEQIIGLPLIATWCEADQLFGDERVYCHLFFGLGDGGALAFFKFAKREDEELFGPKMPASPFHHIALKVDAETQQGIERRLQEAGYREPQTYVLEHGYCRSVYVTDPNGLILEFTLDAPQMQALAPSIQAKAHAELERWMGGDHTSNNVYR
jgi:catechol 2,3-dioxygenase-like lactoylglutathione lyase family enzyme